jgi:Tfp pilus assembly protein PilW
MAQQHLPNGASQSKSVTTSSSSCPFLITDCEDDDSGSNTAAVTSSSSTAGTPTKRRFGYSRQEKSLGTLTRRFMSLLRQSKTGVMDLKHVSLFQSYKLSANRIILKFILNFCSTKNMKQKTIR